jgi:alpha-L-fucosidase 2
MKKSMGKVENFFRKGSVKAAGNNDNWFYQLPHIKQPLISRKAKLKPLKIRKTYLYDFKSGQGESYSFESQ